MKVKFFTILAAILFIVSGSALAQISSGGQPTSFSKSLRSDVPAKIMGFVDVAGFLAEDIEEGKIGMPFRFGAPFDVKYDMDNSGVWESLADGSRVWRLRLECPNAFSTNIVYDEFWLPEGATYFIYNQDQSMVIGAFTSQNNKEHGEFATQPIKGDVCILEYHEPANTTETGVISISRIVHGYRNMFSWDEADKLLDYGGSGSCNNNANCAVGDDWRDEQRSVAMVLLGGGTRWCSGAMVNNVRQDLTPYYLTADHCLNNPSTFIIMFNYESPACTNQDGPTWMTVSGTTLRASNGFSDFALVELSSAPPDSYNVFYSGWSAVDTAGDSCVAIHHPSGDIKKISFNSDPITATDYLGTSIPGNNSHWRVDDWEDGTTEPGSSGSPIYNYDHQIVGQLHGGYASCASITSDWYGKVSQSWATGSSSSTRLLDWLDPDNTGALVLGGRDAAGISITHTPLIDTKDSLNDYEVVAIIQSAVVLNNDSLLLYYRVDAAGWIVNTLIPTGTPDEFSAYIPAQSPASIIDYYLLAVDNDSNADTTDVITFRIIDYGLTLTPASDAKTVAALDSAWYSLTITNVGLYTDEYNLSVSGNSWTTTFWDVTGLTQITSSGSMLADDILDIKVLVEVPSSLYGDFDVVTATVTSVGDPTVSKSSVLTTTSAGQPYAIPFSDEFISTTIDVGKWVLNSNAESNNGGLNPPSAPYSLNLDGNTSGADTIMSQAINLKSETNVIIAYSYEQTGSQDSPETGDNLYIEYLDSLGSWNSVMTHTGDDPDMTDFVYVELPVAGDGYHSNFRLRLRNTATSGAYDDWFVDDIFVGHPSDYDVQLTPSAASTVGPSGDTAVFSLQVHNKGLYDDTYDLVDSGVTWLVSFWDGTGTTQITTLGPVTAGDSSGILVKVAIPGGAAINDNDTAFVKAISQADPGVFSSAVLASESAGSPVAYPWFEPFPDPTLSTVRWFSSGGAHVSDSGLNPPSPPYSMLLDGGIDTAITQLIDLSAKANIILSYYYQSGGLGEAPDAGENLIVQYLNNVGTWITTGTHEGNGVSMNSFEMVNFGLPADAYHNSFQVRFISEGSCVDCDHWFVDDIRIDFAASVAVAPASISVNLQPDDSTTEDLIINNGGPGGLNYTLKVQPVLKSNSLFSKMTAAGDMQPATRPYPEGFDDYTDVKGTDDPRIGLPVDKNGGGPDLFGYYWIDSDEPGGPVFDWIDISATGTDIVGDLNDDNYGGPYALGMDFPFYGTTYSDIYIGSNGILGFGADDMSSRFKVSIPATSTPNNIIAWLWDDLNPDDGDNPNAHVYVGMSGANAVIQFVDYAEYGGAAGDVVSAEIILAPDGGILIQYLTIAAGFDIASNAIGMENSDGTDGLEVAYLTSYLHDNLAVQFFMPAQWLELAQTSGALGSGEADTISCKFTSLGIDPGTYNSNILVISNDPDPADNPWSVPCQLTISDQPLFMCGDVNNDLDGPNITDLTYLVDWMFRGGPEPAIMDAANVDGVDDVNISDLTYLVDYLFKGGPVLNCP